MAHTIKKLSCALVSFVIYFALLPGLGAGSIKPAQARVYSPPPVEMLLLRGRVINAPEKARVRAIHLDGAPAAEARLSPDGQFAFPPLPPKPYHLQVVDIHGLPLPLTQDSETDVQPTDRPLPPEYVLTVIDMPGLAQSTPDASTEAGMGAEVVDAHATGQISGVVTAADTGLPLSGVWVDLYNQDGDYEDYTDATGSYSFTGVAAGIYKVHFVPTRPSIYAQEWYNNQFSREAGSYVSVIDGAIITGINASLEVGARITGKVTAAVGGAPLSTARVYVYDDPYDNLSNYITSAYTNSAGEYALIGLSAGTYYLKFQKTDYAPVYYNQQVNLSEADPVTVALNTTTSNINAALPMGGKISGHVNAAGGGGPLSGVTIYAYDDPYASTYDSVIATTTNSNGEYTVSGLATGNYYLGFYKSDYMLTYYDQQTSLGEADPVSVTLGAVTGNIDVALSMGGKITGHVTAAGGGVPLSGVTIYVYDDPAASTYDYVIATSTNVNGLYTVSGLATGDYYLRFYRPDYVISYYDQQACLGDADAVSVTLGAVTGNIDAVLTFGGRITGKVTSSFDGSPLEGITVRVYDSRSANPDVSVEDDYTDSAGEYSVSGLPAGDYFVKFESSIYREIYYDNRTNQAEADPVNVVLGAETANIDASLDKGGQITGHVTAAEGGAPLPDTTVYIYDSLPDNSYGYVDSTTTDASGMYLLTGLETGDYYLRFSNEEYLETYYNNKTSPSDADPVNAAYNTVTSGIDAVLTLGGKINGHVTAAEGGAPLPDAVVMAYTSPTADLYDYVAYAYTGIAGEYSLPGLTSGVYYLRFSKSDYLTAYYHNQASLSEANPVNVALGKVVGNIDATLSVGSRISGRVTASEGGAPLKGVYVIALNEPPGPDSYSFGAATTDGAGNYTLSGLDAGNYYIYFSPPYDSNYLPQYYPDQASMVTASAVNIGSHAIRSGIDTALLTGGTISGQVTVAESGLPLRDVAVSIYTSEVYCGEEYLNFVGMANTDDSGNYTVKQLPTGNYVAQFWPWWDSASQAYISEYYNDRSDAASADSISVVAGQNRAAINAALTKGGTITGRVTLAGKTGYLKGIRVGIHGDQGWNYTETDSAGSYTFTALAAGSYKVFFELQGIVAGAGYIPDYYNNKAILGSADPVNVSLGGVVSGINAELARGAIITGRVTTADSGTSLEGVDVNVYDSLGNWAGEGVTDMNGNYSTSGLATGNYRLEFSPRYWPRDYLSEYYSDKSSLAAADAIAVSLPDATVVNAALQRGGTISGTVRSAIWGKPLVDYTVTILDEEQNEIQRTYTDKSGQYLAPGLPTGTYNVHFFLPGTCQVPVIELYYNQKPDLDSADPVTVIAPEVTGHIDGEFTVNYSFLPFIRR